MKHLKKVLLILLVVVSFNSINAQDEDNPWAIEISTNAVDFYPTGASFTNPDGGSYLGDYFDEPLNFDDHWNIVSAISRIRVSHYVGSKFAIGLAGSYNSISKIGDFKTTNDLTYFGLDLDINYTFLKKNWFNTYLILGGGYTWLDGEGNPTINGGLGTNLWFNDNIGLSLSGIYKHSFDEDKMLPHFQYSLGIIFKFGGKDTDGDGVYDKYDSCPEVAGLEAFNGCPDTDSDGIQDSEDACPDVAGLAELNGCPDADADGIADKDDACPKEVGTLANNGCPDADGDGVVDKDDACINEVGPAENKGCPWPDTDGDGVLDKDDDCPNVTGVAANKGCPEVTEEVQEEINILAKQVYFNTGKTTFTDETLIRLDGINKILSGYSALKFEIGGHTDSTGSKKINDKLSQARAEAVMNYLVSKGFPAANIKAVGYGPSNPIGSNKTRKGRQQNRRVEVVYLK